jgi:hypothetical protein
MHGMLLFGVAVLRDHAAALYPASWWGWFLICECGRVPHQWCVSRAQNQGKRIWGSEAM